MGIDESPDIAQFSAESAAQLAAATTTFKSALEEYVKTVTQLRGGSAEIPTVFDANEVLRREAVRCNDAAGDHTGTFLLSLEDFDQGDGEEDDEAELEAAGAESESVYEISVVSRWDLEVSDAEALIEAGRAAHRRLWPEESDEDARAVIAHDDIGPALYALLHARGEPWTTFPGCLC